MNGWFIAAGTLLTAAFFVHVVSGNRFYTAACPGRNAAADKAYEAWLMGRCGVQMITADLALGAVFLLLLGFGAIPRNFQLELFLLLTYGGWFLLWLVSLGYERGAKTRYLRLCHWALFLSVEALPLWPLTLIPAASRACAALAVLTLRPMSTSQYSAMTRGGAPVVFAAIVLAAVCGLSVLLWDSFAPLAAAVCYWLAAWYAFRQLDGMSGDVSGFALTIAELGGAAVLVLWR